MINILYAKSLVSGYNHLVRSVSSATDGTNPNP